MPGSHSEEETGSGVSRSGAAVRNQLLVYVLGLPASGAAEASAALAPLGLSPPGEAGAGGPSIAELNRSVLSRLGGSLHAPPPAPAEWAAEASLQRLREAASAAASALGRQPTSWFDPANCLLLGFWRHLVTVPSAAVLVYRDPLDNAYALRESDNLDPAHALALWEHLHRRALGALDGMAAMLVSHEEVVSGDPAWIDRAASWLGSLGWLPGGDPGTTERAAEGERGSGTGRPAEGARGSALLDSQEALHQTLRSATGQHDRWSVPDLGEENPWVSSLIASLRRGAVLREDSRHLVKAFDWAVDRLEELLPGPSPEEDAGDRPVIPLNAGQNAERYRDWVARRSAEAGPPGPPGSRPVEGGPSITVVVPVYRPRPWYLTRCIESVLAQTYPNWELCLCDDGSADPLLSSLLEEAAERDPRVRVAALGSNRGISAASNVAISLGTGGLVAFLDHDDELAPDALAVVAETSAGQPEADVIYSDEDKLDDRGARCEPTFKPDWSPDWLMSTAYLCHLLVVRRSLVDELGGLCSEFDGSQDFDLALRACERARSVAHIPQILYHWRMVAGSAAENSEAKPWAHEASRRVIEAALARRGEEGRVDEGAYAGIYNVRRSVRSRPTVSVIVPFRDEAALLTTCIESIGRLGGYDNVELVLVDNASSEPEATALVDRLRDRPRTRVLSWTDAFNWSAINNAAVSESAGEMLLFLNNDVEGLSQDWLLAMLEHAQRREVGAVGARLVYPDMSVQHVGIVVGLHGKTGHVLQGIPDSDPGYMGMSKLTRNYSAVTGACMMTRRQTFLDLGGFDEEMAVGYSDIDYCLRARREGLLVVFTPVAELLHAESRTRGQHDDECELEMFLRRWKPEIEKGDPYYNRNLWLESPYCELPVESEEREWYAE